MRLAILVLATALLAPGTAGAFKWYECPAPPVPVHPSVLGAAGSPFIHPGHAFSIYLNEAELAASGGFGTSADANRVSIEFASLFGSPVTLQPRLVAAVSPAVLTFAFPDTLVELGRTLAGPVQIVVTTGDVETARIAAADLVALPPAVDFAPYLLGDEPDLVVGAALGAEGDLWIPAFFSGHPMGMPGCEGNFIMPLPMEIGGATIVGDVFFPFDPTTRIRKVSGYIGDMVINGTDFYGLLYPQRIQLLQVGDTLGVSVCRLNDAEDLVLRIQGDRGWVAKRSPYRLVLRDSSPLPLRLHKAAPVPRSPAGSANGKSADAPGRVDSFGSQCVQMPTSGTIKSSSAGVVARTK